MHKLMEYICDELEEFERKADKEGKLSMAEMQYVDLLAHTKKNLLKADEMWEESEYSMAMDGGMTNNGSYVRNGQDGRTRSNRGGSYARGRGRNARRDSMGRYSNEGGYSRYPASYGTEDMMDDLRELMQDAPDQQTRQEFQRFIQKLEQMQ